MRLYVHRVAWVIYHGQDIPEGMVIDQTCENKACCAEDHLECVTQSVNVDRYHESKPSTGTCSRGHEIVTGLVCATCRRERVAAWKAKNPDRMREIQRKHDVKRGKANR